MRKHLRAPPFAKNAKGVAPILLVMPAKSEAWAPATFPRQHRRASCDSLRGTHKSNKENIQ